MVATNAREVLAKENELLDELIAKATIYSQNSGGLMAEIFDGWVKGLTRPRDINVKLINENDTVFEGDVVEEIHLLEHVVSTIKTNGEVTSSWVEHLTDDIGFLKKLL